MKAVAGDLPRDDAGWAFEIKWDGMRAIVELEGGAVRMRTTRRNEVQVGYPELDHLGDAVGGRPAVLDGEVVAFDDAGRPSFSLLQQRMHVADRPSALARAAQVPVVFVAFDLLWFDGHDCAALPYLDRRRLLADVVDEGPWWRVPEHHVGDGATLLEAARRSGLEGVVAKRVDRPYLSGKRSSWWRKVKIRLHQEFVVGGWNPGAGTRAGAMGSLLLGCHRDGRLRYVGNVGTGFDAAELARLGVKLDALATDECPFDPAPPRQPTRDARWVRPELVVECEFGEWTPDGRLRHPAYLGERIDKDAADVTCDP
jgi:bifunctional non-homologous end joining protein LigD